jgi:hypothetical protein
MKRISFQNFIMTILISIPVFAQSGANPQGTGVLNISARLLNYQSFLTDTLGNPVNNNSLAATFAIFDSLTGGHKLWEDTLTLDAERGIFHAVLGRGVPFSDSLFLKAADYGLQVTIGGQALTPRSKIGSVGYTLTTITADTADYAVQADDDDWHRGAPPQDSVLFTVRPLGLAKGASSNMLYGNAVYSHTNFGYACTTGVSGYNYPYVTLTGGWRNVAAETAATITGGYRNKALGRYATVTGGGMNYTAGAYSVIVGGNSDTAYAPYGGILSGYYNRAGDSPLDTCAVVAGGMNNSAWEKYSWIGGGRDNTALNYYAAIPGGFANSAWGQYSTVAGGQNNFAYQHFSAILGGVGDTARSVFGGIAGGASNNAGQTATDSFAICMAGYDNQALSKYSFIGGGRNNLASDSFATVIGGYSNQAIARYSTVIGGYNNSANGQFSAIGGGYQNTAASGYGVVIGGYANVVNNGSYSAVAGGYLDTVSGNYGFAAGNNSVVPAAYSNATAFNGQTVTASGETHVGILSKASGTFTIDHPLDPDNKILNHYFVESPDMTTIYRGTAVLDKKGQAEVFLPAYFDTLNRRPLIQVSTSGPGDAYIREKVKGNRFVIGGTPGIEVSWIVTGQRRDPTAEITRIMMPVEQVKEGDLAGHYLDDDLLRATRKQLLSMGVADRFKYRATTGSGSNGEKR